jgi:hypothetical protein
MSFAANAVILAFFNSSATIFAARGFRVRLNRIRLPNNHASAVPQAICSSFFTPFFSRGLSRSHIDSITRRKLWLFRRSLFCEMQLFGFIRTSDAEVHDGNTNGIFRGS